MQVRSPAVLSADRSQSNHDSKRRHPDSRIERNARGGRRLDDFAASEAVLRPADLTNTVTYEADHNRSDMATLLARFRSRRESFVARVDALSNEDAARNSRHPRLDKPMRIIDHCLFIAEHDDHHMAIITSLANKNA